VSGEDISSFQAGTCMLKATAWPRCGVYSMVLLCFVFGFWGGVTG